ncbi:MAG TPA: ABC transporter transmembrane domain-containing protein [Chryseosolibacter sp.]
MVDKDLNSLIVLQTDHTDCGVACVKTILKYFEIDDEIVNLRVRVGKSRSGSTMLGLQEGLAQYSIKSNGYEADIEHLKGLKFPAILHTVLGNRFLHFIVLFDFRDGFFRICDPANGIRELTSEELQLIWKSKRVLVIEDAPKQPTSASKNVLQPRSSFLVSAWALLRKYQNQFITSCIISLFISILSLVFSIATQLLVDHSGVGDAYISATFTSLFLLLLLRALLTFGRSKVVLNQVRDSGMEFGEIFTKKLFSLKHRTFEEKSIGDFTSRFHDATKIQLSIANFLNQTVVDLFLLVCLTIFLVSKSYLFGLPVLVCAIVLFFLAKMFRKKIRSGQERVIQSFAAAESGLIESLNGMDTIKSFNKEVIFEKRQNSILARYYNESFTFGNFRAKLNALLDCLTTIVVTVICWAAFFKFSKSSISLGESVAVVQLTLLIPSLFSRLFFEYVQVQENLSALSRIDSVFIEPFSIVEEYKTIEGPVRYFEANQISFKFPGRLPLFADVSWSSRPGDLVLFKADSGRGKTTLFKIIQRIYNATSGDIWMNGHNIKTIEPSTLSSRLAYMPQDIKIFNASLSFNITMDETFSEEEVKLFCAKIGIAEAIATIPNDYAAVVGEFGVKLSGGQRQIVGFARAMFKNPEILILDEPTSSMDPQLEKILFRSVEMARSNMMVFVSSHSSTWDDFASTTVLI